MPHYKKQRMKSRKRDYNVMQIRGKTGILEKTEDDRNLKKEKR